ncbi:MAG TPA: signal peptide peptidase SppA [Candidatus Methylomirabilis sp.]
MGGSRGRWVAVWALGGLALFLVVVGLAAALLGPRLPFGGERVAIIAIEGVIADSREVIEQLHRYRDLPGVRAVVLRINSPGGAVAPAQEIYQEVLKFRRQTGKPVVASLGSVAASGGYYVAAAADRIVANPGSITGSIGVILQIPNVSGLLQKVGIKTTVIKAGENKDLGSITRDLTEAERRILQEVMDDVHAQFIEAVAQGRRMDRARLEPLADGRIFSGRQALGLGLVDELGDLPDAIERAGSLVGIPGRPKVIQERRRRSWLWDLLTETLGPVFPVGGPAAPVAFHYLWQ